MIIKSCRGLPYFVSAQLDEGPQGVYSKVGSYLLPEVPGSGAPHSAVQKAKDILSSDSVTIQTQRKQRDGDDHIHLYLPFHKGKSSHMSWNFTRTTTDVSQFRFRNCWKAGSLFCHQSIEEEAFYLLIFFSVLHIKVVLWRKCNDLIYQCWRFR